MTFGSGRHEDRPGNRLANFSPGRRAGREEEDTMKLRLEFEVEYDPAGVDQEELADMLAEVAKHALSVGLVTGETPATVENSHICVRDLETGECV